MSLLARVQAHDFFDELEREQEQPTDKIIEVRAGTILEKLVRQFEEYLVYGNIRKDLCEGLREIGECEEGIRARDIEKFSLFLNRYNRSEIFEVRAGDFLTCCFSDCKDYEINIYTTGWKNSPNFLSLQTDKRVTVYGNVGDWLGLCMTRGRITVNGNARGSVGSGMEGGTIHLNGDYDGITEVINTKRNIYHKGKPVVLDGIVL